MHEFQSIIVVIFVFVVICFILGALTRNKEKNEKDRNDTMETFLRGLGYFLLIFGAITICGIFGYLIFSILG